MGQSQVTAKLARYTVITNALVIDVAGIYKADIGLRDGQTAPSGGNPDTQPDVDIIVGPEPPLQLRGIF